MHAELGPDVNRKLRPRPLGRTLAPMPKVKKRFRLAPHDVARLLAPRRFIEETGEAIIARLNDPTPIVIELRPTTGGAK